MESLIVLGASARALAQSARRAGFAPYAIDLFADRDLAACCHAVRISRYPAEFLPALQSAPPGPWMYTGGLENHPRLLDRLAKIRPHLGNGGDVVRPVRRPENVLEAAVAAGCRFPRLDSSGGPVLVKPRRGSGGLGVRIANDSDLIRVPSGCYLQELVAGDCASAVYVAGGEHATLLGATRQLVGRDFALPLPFAYVGSIGPLPIDEDVAVKLQRLGTELARRFGLLGLFNVDLMLGDGDVWVLEVNPRYSASMEILERVSGLPLMRLHVESCKGRSLTTIGPPRLQAFFGKAVVYADTDGVVPLALDALPQAWNDDTELADIPRVGDQLVKGQPVVTVLANGASLEAVEAKLRQCVEDVRGVFHRAAVGTVHPTGH